MTDEELKKKARACYSKKRYTSQESSDKVASIIIANNKDPNRVLPKRSYYCTECCGWHHTSKGDK